jgi:hypothetical protein
LIPWASITARTCIKLVQVSDSHRKISTRTYSLLEASQVSGAEGVSLGNNGNQVDSGAQTLHDFDIKRLQGVAGGANEVEAGMDTEVDLVRSAGLLLLQHIRLMLVIEELNNGLPRIAVVDVVTKSRGVDNGKADWVMVVSKWELYSI